jgi:hypothetical protein
MVVRAMPRPYILLGEQPCRMGPVGGMGVSAVWTPNDPVLHTEAPQLEWMAAVRPIVSRLTI